MPCPNVQMLLPSQSSSLQQRSPNVQRGQWNPIWFWLPPHPQKPVFDLRHWLLCGSDLTQSVTPVDAAESGLLHDTSVGAFVGYVDGDELGRKVGCSDGTCVGTSEG